MLFKFLVLGFVALAASAPEQYSDNMDNMNIDEILENRRLLEAYINCFLDKAKCTPAGKKIKGMISSSLRTGCETCSQEDKDNSAKVMRHLIAKEVGFWNDLCSKYDPDGVWRKKYEDEAKAMGVNYA